VHVPRGREKKIQRALLQYRDRKNRKLVAEGLRDAGRNEPIEPAGSHAGLKHRSGK
jgi:hypothetical protein